MAVAVRVRPQVPNYFKLGVDISYSDAIIYT